MKTIMFSVLTSIFLISSASATVLFSDNFSNGLGNWDILSSGEGTGTVSTTSLNGRPEPCVMIEPGVDQWTIIRSKVQFSYVGKDIQFSADMKAGQHESYQSTSMFFNYFVGGNGASLACLIIDTYPDYNSEVKAPFAQCGWNHLDGSYDYSLVELPDSPTGWYRGQISIRNDGYIDYFVDGAYLCTSSSTIDPGLESLATIDLYGGNPYYLGGYSYYYDNVLVTPEPATLVLLGLGGLFFARKKK